MLLQNPEPAADFDTVANEKKQHEVNVGKIKLPCLDNIKFNVEWDFLRAGSQSCT